jgi:predicted nucleic acid-binding protein
VYLLDTSVASALAPGRQTAGAEDVIEWLRAREPTLHFSTMTVMEIRSGIERLVRAGSTRRQAELSAWLVGLVERFKDRVLAFDREAAMIAGRIEGEAYAAGRHPGLPDIIIAATAARHGLIVLTQNLRHFSPLGVGAIDPFRSLPESQ